MDCAVNFADPWLYVIVVEGEFSVDELPAAALCVALCLCLL